MKNIITIALAMLAGIAAMAQSNVAEVDSVTYVLDEIVVRILV